MCLCFLVSLCVCVSLCVSLCEHAHGIECKFGENWSRTYTRRLSEDVHTTRPNTHHICECVCMRMGSAFVGIVIISLAACVRTRGFYASHMHARMTNTHTHQASSPRALRACADGTFMIRYEMGRTLLRWDRKFCSILACLMLCFEQMQFWVVDCLRII